MYVVLLAKNFSAGADAQPVLPRVVAHNLSREAAEQMKRDLSPASSIEGESVGVSVFLWCDNATHSTSDPDQCPECAQVVAAHCRKMLAVLEEEAAKRGSRIIEEGLRN